MLKPKIKNKTENPILVFLWPSRTKMASKMTVFLRRSIPSGMGRSKKLSACRHIWSQNRGRLEMGSLSVNMLSGLPALVMAVAFMLVMVAMPLVQADRFDDQIKELNQQNSVARAQVNVLQVQADSLEQVIQRLRDQISALQAQISANQVKSVELQQKIKEAEAELARQKDVLGQNIKAMYLEGQISTIEMLATSKNLSQYIDKQQYREVVKDKIKDQVDKITQLRLELKKQKELLEKLIADQQAMQGQMAADQAEQDRLLGLNQGQQNELFGQIRANNAKAAEIRAAQAAAFAAATGGGRRSSGALGSFQFRNLSAQQYCGGGYSYCGAYHDQWVSDTWGLGLARECVHYTADRAARGMYLAPYLGGGRGNAYQWPDSLPNSIAYTDRNPAVGAVAVANSSQIPPVGHTMYVEYITNDGWVGVSQMNFDGRGSYSTMEVKSSSVEFIHFR